MSSHVVVIDKTARRFTIKVSPETVLNEVFQQACKKAAVDPSLHGLRHGNKILDLSLPFRFTKLSPGAKLELVQLPKARSSAPSSVTVALQMMDSSNNTRVTEKFPNTISIWSILRSFEQKSRSLGVGGINITEQAVVSANQSGESGRLFYAMPVVQIVNRELATLEDLQKTLQEMGFTSGTALLRLKMRPTEIPLEEAMEKISGFTPAVTPLPASPAELAPILPSPPPPPPQNTPVIEGEPLSSVDTGNMDMDIDLISSAESDFSTIPTPSTVPSQSSLLIEVTKLPPLSRSPPQPRGVTVLAPAQGTVPEAAKLQFDESEYDLTIAQARKIQANLAASSRPQRLLSEAELAEKERERIEKREKVSEIEIRVRFPDHMIIQAVFKGIDKAEDLYSFVRSTLRYPEEPFYLYIAPPVKRISPQGGTFALDLQFAHRTLVNFSWEQAASGKAITEPALNDNYLRQAKAIKVDKSQLEVAVVQGEDEDEDKGKKREADRPGGSASGSGSRNGGKLPKWLKLGGKK
ncbi:GLUT4 regulating protein TUG-domain-containing protein [Tirmania nivea]|nr:GLUT4 regulating protein TUG-domain-containing protein [Tirmania nivea]